MTLIDELELHEVRCFECSRPISSIPAWLADAAVKFQCEECRQKSPRIPGMADVELRRGLSVSAEEPLEVHDEVQEETDEDIIGEAEEYVED